MGFIVGSIPWATEAWREASFDRDTTSPSATVSTGTPVTVLVAETPFAHRHCGRLDTISVNASAVNLGIPGFLCAICGGPPSLRNTIGIFHGPAFGNWIGADGGSGCVVPPSGMNSTDSG